MKPLLLIVFNFITGTACVIYGVKLMSCSLEKSNIKVIEKALGLFTRNLCTSFCSGTIMTALVQSSTAVTVVTVGLVNSGLLNLIQAAGIIYGANIGTTITAQFMSINFYGISWVLIIGGFLLRLAFKRTYTRQLGTAVIGMGIMLAGLEILDGGIHLVRQSHAASGIFLKYGEKPILAAFTGMSTAMLVQSSSAVTGLTIILFNGGLLGFEAAIALTLGANIGTCITAQAASIGTSLAARRTAWIHTSYFLYAYSCSKSCKTIIPKTDA